MPDELILVVDDEQDIQELLQYNLEKSGYRVMCASTGEEAVVMSTRHLPDLIILDLMLPGIDGRDVCRILKKNTSTDMIPIIMLTARTEASDIVAGLELGADDYVTKPFSPGVLIARIRSVLRREQKSEPVPDEMIQQCGIVLHPGHREVTVTGEPVILTATEFDLLHLLMGRPGWVFSRSQIISSVKGDDYPVTERAIDVQVVGLRKKLGRSGDLIETVRGVGYRFKGK